MRNRKTRQKYRIGSVVAVPLPDGKFAFAKIFKDYDLGVYGLISDKPERLESVIRCKIAFYQAVTSSPIKSGDWVVIGEDPFPDEESSWGPPRVVGVLPGMTLDPMLLNISHKGRSRRATLDEVDGLEIETFCHRPEHSWK